MNGNCERETSLPRAFKPLAWRQPVTDIVPLSNRVVDLRVPGGSIARCSLVLPSARVACRARRSATGVRQADSWVAVLKANRPVQANLRIRVGILRTPGRVVDPSGVPLVGVFET